MAETAQDSTVPLRGGDGKIKDEDAEDGAYDSDRHAMTVRLPGCRVVCAHFQTCCSPGSRCMLDERPELLQWSTRRSSASRRELFCKKPGSSTSPT
jgi:hypothetical protein